MAEPEYHPEASDEVANAFAHYASVNSEVGERFKLELDRAEQLVQRSPDSWEPYFHGRQGFRFRGFPFVMAYIVRDERIIVIAVAHTRRTPGYWRIRLTDCFHSTVAFSGIGLATGMLY